MWYDRRDLYLTQNNARRIWQLMDMWRVMKWVKPEIICTL